MRQPPAGMRKGYEGVMQIPWLYMISRIHYESPLGRASVDWDMEITAGSVNSHECLCEDLDALVHEAFQGYRISALNNPGEVRFQR